MALTTQARALATGSARTVASMLTCYIQQQVHERHKGNDASCSSTLLVDAAEFIANCRQHVQDVLRSQEADVCHTAARLAEVRLNRSAGFGNMTILVQYEDEGVLSDPYFEVTVSPKC